MKSRRLVLVLAAAVISSLVLWRYSREGRHRETTVSVQPRQLAPRFELYDQHSQLVKFERYLGRTEMLVVFVDDATPLDAQPLLVRLRDSHDALKSTGLQVIAISQATPHAVREAERRAGVEFPFPVLTDIDMRTPVPAPVHRLWGLANDDPSDIRRGTFFVDRSGRVVWENGAPEPLDDPDAFIDERLGVTRSLES